MILGWRIKKILENTVILKWNIVFHKIICSHFFCTVQLDTVYQKVLFNSCFCSYVMEFTKLQNILCASEASLWFTQKSNFCLMNKIKLVWFYSSYRNYFFVSKCDLFIYFENIFAMLHLKIFREYWIILYIFRILLCVTSP